MDFGEEIATILNADASLNAMTDLIVFNLIEEDVDDTGTYLVFTYREVGHTETYSFKRLATDYNLTIHLFSNSTLILDNLHKRLNEYLEGIDNGKVRRINAVDYTEDIAQADPLVYARSIAYNAKYVN